MMMRIPDSEILGYIREYLEQRGYPPTVREIADGVGLRSTAAVSYRLVRLEERGRIERDRGVPRGIRLTAQAKV